MDPRATVDAINYDFTQGNSNIFGYAPSNTSPMPDYLAQGGYYEDLDGLAENDPKRRRIARVSTHAPPDDGINVGSGL
jgi:hypothetical protein